MDTVNYSSTGAMNSTANNGSFNSGQESNTGVKRLSEVRRRFSDLYQNRHHVFEDEVCTAWPEEEAMSELPASPVDRLGILMRRRTLDKLPLGLTAVCGGEVDDRPVPEGTGVTQQMQADALSRALLACSLPFRDVSKADIEF